MTDQRLSPESSVCQECGQPCKIGQRHTYIDCVRWRVKRDYQANCLDHAAADIGACLYEIDALQAENEELRKQHAAAYQEQQRRNRDEVELAGHLGMESAVNVAVEREARLQAELDQRTAEVAALTALLRKFPGCSWRHLAHRGNCKICQALADTAKAAQEYRKQARLEGAAPWRKQWEQLVDDFSRAVPDFHKQEYIEAVLREMEAEANG